MREVGLVVNVEANNAYVQIDRKTACESCKACGLGTSDEKSIIVQAINNIKAQKGDIVELDLESPDVLLAAFIIYGLPPIRIIRRLLFILTFIYILFVARAIRVVHKAITSFSSVEQDIFMVIILKAIYAHM